MRHAPECNGPPPGGDRHRQLRHGRSRTTSATRWPRCARFTTAVLLASRCAQRSPGTSITTTGAMQPLRPRWASRRRCAELCRALRSPGARCRHQGFTLGRGPRRHHGRNSWPLRWRGPKMRPCAARTAGRFAMRTCFTSPPAYCRELIGHEHRKHRSHPQGLGDNSRRPRARRAGRSSMASWSRLARPQTFEESVRSMARSSPRSPAAGQPM